MRCSSLDEEFPSHWYDALVAVATRTWQVLMRHPWAPYSLQNALPGPNAMRHFEQSLAAVAETGLDPAATFALLAMADDYVHGNALRSAEVRTGAAAGSDEQTEVVEAAMRFTERQLATGEFPHTRALFGGADPREMFPRLIGAMSERERFLNGLTALLDGVAARPEPHLAATLTRRGPRDDRSRTKVGVRPGVTCVTELFAGGDSSCWRFSGGTPSKIRCCAPRGNGTMCSRSSSIRPAARSWSDRARSALDRHVAVPGRLCAPASARTVAGHLARFRRCSFTCEVPPRGRPGVVGPAWGLAQSCGP